MIQLEEFPQQLHQSADRCIALSGEKQITEKHLFERIEYWQSQISHLNCQKPALFHNNTLEFCAALLACWKYKLAPVIPPNIHPETLEALAQEGIDGYIGEFHKNTNSDALKPLSVKQPTQYALGIFTSGSTGQPTCIFKTFEQLNHEITALENQFGDNLPKKSLFIGTVSHHHIYGLIFRLLWPLITGRFWQSQIQLHTDPSKTYGSDLQVLITSPANLERLPKADTVADQARHWKAVFCSAAPLDDTAATACLEQFHSHPHEIFGSSETGGVAWRQQLLNPRWQALPGVEVSTYDNPECPEQQLLAVDSLTAGGHQKTQDIIEMYEESEDFALKGRADTIAKVAGKRVSLTKIAKHLIDHPRVLDAKIVQLPERGGRLGAVVVLNSQGNKQLINSTRQAFNAELKEYLLNYFEAVSVPRYWRYCDQLPINLQGKSPVSLLCKLFDKEQPAYPEIIATRQLPEGVELDLFIQPELRCFNGHFPGRSVLAGVVQLDWAIYFARAHLGELNGFCGLEAIKYQQVVSANQTVTLSLTIQKEKKKLSFRYHRADESLSSGRVKFALINLQGANSNA